MSMKFMKGDIIESDAEAIINTVNTVGVMGKGIALQFKERFPANFKLYAAACKKGQVVIGKMFITSTDSMMNPKWIINFPTKKHWIHKSSYAYIESGLDDLVLQIKKLNIRSIAIPPLGAGQGGLDWNIVKRMITEKLGGLGINVIVFEPAMELKMHAEGKKAHLTKSRALILSLINHYRLLGYEISLLEIQKLAYFLQRMGQTDLKLHYKEYLYGPYAHNLQHLLHELEKGYIKTQKPILDSRPFDIVHFNTSTAVEVADYVTSECSADEKTRLEHLERLMAGFESPFGLELLATVDWIINREKNSALSPEQLKAKVKEWSKRKDDNFSIGHIAAARQRLNEFSRDLTYA